MLAPEKRGRRERTLAVDDDRFAELLGLSQTSGDVAVRPETSIGSMRQPTKGHRWSRRKSTEGDESGTHPNATVLQRTPKGPAEL